MGSTDSSAPLSLALFVAGVIIPLAPLVYVVVTSRNRTALTLDTSFLGFVIAAGIFAIVARIGALAEVWVAAGRRTSLDRLEVLTSLVAAIALIGGVVGVVQVGQARSAIAPTFTPITDGPLFDAEQPLVALRDSDGPPAASVPDSTSPAETAGTTTPRDGAGEFR